MTEEKAPPKAAAAEGKPEEKPAKAPPPPKPVEPTGEIVETAVTRRLHDEFGDAVKGVNNPFGEATVLVDKEKLIEVLTFLRDDPECFMNFLTDQCGAHYPTNEKVFQVVYQCYSIPKNHNLRVKVELDDGETCPTAVEVWGTADWHEREIHDMFGIVFEGHPNLKTILLPDDWEGHPLRKEYPLGGPKEEMIRKDAYSKPQYLPDDADEAAKIIEEGRRGS
jgi:NADH-quinone oxidoreductase subunit C